MIEQIKNYAAPHTRWFIFNWVIYFILLIFTTVYCYARIDFVRTQPLQENVEQT